VLGAMQRVQAAGCRRGVKPMPRGPQVAYAGGEGRKLELFERNIGNRSVERREGKGGQAATRVDVGGSR
jgi:hypothetical protein